MTRDERIKKLRSISDDGLIFMNKLACLGGISLILFIALFAWVSAYGWAQFIFKIAVCIFRQ